MPGSFIMVKAIARSQSFKPLKAISNSVSNEWFPSSSVDMEPEYTMCVILGVVHPSSNLIDDILMGPFQTKFPFIQSCSLNIQHAIYFQSYIDWGLRLPLHYVSCLSEKACQDQSKKYYLELPKCDAQPTICLPWPCHGIFARVYQRHHCTPVHACQLQKSNSWEISSLAWKRWILWYWHWFHNAKLYNRQTLGIEERMVHAIWA